MWMFHFMLVGVIKSKYGAFSRCLFAPLKIAVFEQFDWIWPRFQMFFFVKENLLFTDH